MNGSIHCKNDFLVHHNSNSNLKLDTPENILNKEIESNFIESSTIYQNTTGQMRKTELYDSNPHITRFVAFDQKS